MGMKKRRQGTYDAEQKSIARPDLFYNYATQPGYRYVLLSSNIMEVRLAITEVQLAREEQKCEGTDTQSAPMYLYYHAVCTQGTVSNGYST